MAGRVSSGARPCPSSHHQLTLLWICAALPWLVSSQALPEHSRAAQSLCVKRDQQLTTTASSSCLTSSVHRRHLRQADAADPASTMLGQGHAVPAYVGIPHDPDMAAVHSNVQRYLATDAFKARRRSIQQQLEPRGILICAGGPKLVTSLVILLRVLRRHLNCTLPVEIAWYGGYEMDDATLASLQRNFAPLVGTDLTTLKYPQHHRPGFGMVSKGRQRFVGKTYALLHCRFREVLMLDADSLPLVDPRAHFLAAAYRRTGNQFWPDAWATWVKDDVYRLLGLDAAATKKLIGRGKGFVQRDAEAGQVVFDRGRHADVLEYLFFINSFFDKVYDHVHGDKDTFALAFAMAGKAHEYNQMSVPPGCVFHWGQGVLEVKGTKRMEDGWQLVGFLQYDASPYPAFFHRTMDKWSVVDEPWPMQLVTGPLPYRWARYYLAHDSQGPTKGVMWQHVVPRHALRVMHQDPLVPLARAAQGGQWVQERPLDLYSDAGCPLVRYLQIQRLRALGLPVDLDDATAAACGGAAAALMAAATTSATSVTATSTWRSSGTAGTTATATWPFNATALLRPEYLELSSGSTGTAAVVQEVRPDETPLAALRVGRGRTRSRAVESIRRAYDARLWLRHHRSQFPLLSQAVSASQPQA